MNSLRESEERVRGEDQSAQGVAATQTLRNTLQLVPGSNEVFLNKRTTR